VYLDYQQNVSYIIFGLVSVIVENISITLNSITASKARGLHKFPARLSKMVHLS